MSTSSLNHLLNFTYERPVTEPTPYKKRNARGRAYNKEHFLRANFRFIIAPSAPVAHPAVYEADTLIDWDFVDEVCLSKPATAAQCTCPICLDVLRVPKITKCGHIFCTPCILRHLHPYDTHRCPMCFDTVARSDLRRLHITTIRQPELNGKLDFTLLSRVKGTLTPRRMEGAEGPVEEEVLTLAQLLPLVGSDDASFARLVVGSRESQEAGFAREEEALREVGKQMASEGEEGYMMIVEEALRDLDERRRKALACLTASPSLSSTTSMERHSPVGRRNRPRGESGGEEMLQFGSPDSPCGDVAGEREAKAVAPASDISYFFQLSDGQYVFLHPFNMKCLMAEAEGSYGRLPTRVEGKVLELEPMTLTQEVRSRWPFLKHLPLYSQVVLAELDLKLSDATYARFRADIQKRKQRRKAKVRAQKAAAAKDAGASEEHKLGLVGFSEGELQEMRARREHVDLNGPLPWEASLMVEGKDVSPMPDRMSDLTAPFPEGPDAPPSESMWVRKKGGGSFAEITKMNGHFPSLANFPTLGGGLGIASGGRAGPDSAGTSQSASSTSSSPPTGMSPPSIGMSPPSIWASRNPLLSSSPPQISGGSPIAWGAVSRQTPALSGGKPTGTLAAACDWQAMMEQTMGETGTSDTGGSAANSAKKKKSRPKGVPLFSIGSQRKY